MNDELDFLKILKELKNRWKWFLLGIVLSVITSYVYLRYTKLKYEVSSTIMIDDKDSGNMMSEFSAFDDLGVFGNSAKKSINNEIGMLSSRSIMKKVVQELKINISYYAKGRISNYEVYGRDVPFRINFFIADSTLHILHTEFEIKVLSKTKYQFQKKKDDNPEIFEFGKNINTTFGELNIVPSKINNIAIGESLIVKIKPLSIVADNYRNRIKISMQDSESSLLVLSLREEVKEKAKDILNTLVKQYINDGIEFKTMISESTDKFVNARINDISLDLYDIDKGVEEFKKKNRLTDIGIEAGLDLTSNTASERNLVELNSQIKLVDYVIKYLSENKQSLIPANLGLNDAETNQTTYMYNQLILERNRILKSSSLSNPTVINIEAQLETIRQSVNQSLLNFRSALIFSSDEVRRQLYRINVKREAAPQQEREFQDIKRRQQIIESLYLYLLQKREENALSLGIPIPNAKIVDIADGSNIPVFPKPKLIYMLFVLAGLIITFLITYIISLFDNKVHTYEDIEAIVSAPIIGDIPISPSKKKVVIGGNNSTIMAESFRLLRANVNFMLNNATELPKSIFVTSTIGSEGKTFVAINLAISLGLMNKRVLLIGADVRKPKIANYLGIKTKAGLSHYLVDQKLNVSDIIYKYDEMNIDIIGSGEIPPNPSELLLNGRFENVLIYGKEHYDFVIIDTAPVNLVTDTLLLGSKADLFIYVVRAEFLDKTLLRVPQLMFEKGRLPNMAMLINASIKKHSAYGYGYGYKENKGKNKWWKRS